MKEGVILMNLQDQHTLGPLRADPGLLIAEQEDQLWLRGFEDSPLPDVRISALPAKQVFYLGTSNALFPKGGLTPVRQLPDLDWQPLAEWLSLSLPTSAMPGKTNETIQARLIRVPTTGKVQPGAALLMHFSRWKAYAENAPQVRLAPLKFAVAKNGLTLITGLPLPPVPGQEYWLTEQLLIPAGYTLELPSMAPILARKLNPAKDSYVLMDTSGKWELIPLNAFVPATRSAVRLTAEGVQNG